MHFPSPGLVSSDSLSDFINKVLYSSAVRFERIKQVKRFVVILKKPLNSFCKVPRQKELTEHGSHFHGSSKHYDSRDQIPASNSSIRRRFSLHYFKANALFVINNFFFSLVFFISIFFSFSFFVFLSKVFIHFARVFFFASPRDKCSIERKW